MIRQKKIFGGVIRISPFFAGFWVLFSATKVSGNCYAKFCWKFLVFFREKMPRLGVIFFFRPTTNRISSRYKTCITNLIPRNRFYSTGPPQFKMSTDSKSTLLYTASVVIGFIGLSFAAVPLYQLFCSATGIGSRN